jgi:hypothetical protein
MDEHCVFTTEEDQVMSKAQFLKELSPLPPGLAGGSAVGDLQVPQYPTFAIARFLADEWETVFGRRVGDRHLCARGEQLEDGRVPRFRCLAEAGAERLLAAPTIRCLWRKEIAAGR